MPSVLVYYSPMTGIKTNENLFDAEHRDNILSVSSLNHMARSLLEGNFPAVIVEGEISNLAKPASGHWYLSLKDKSSQIRCAMFAGRNRSVNFKPCNGNQIIIRGKLSIYEGRGDYQLIVESMEEAGDGALRRAFEELKNKLLNEGLFADSAKQEVHSQYKHIGVITSPSGAAIQDILSVMARRFPATEITLLPVAVQGKGAADEIVTAIKTANRHQGKLGIQALIVGRGGGSLEDLQAFNTEVVARAIFASELPVCSAVGHEIDFTVADFVADLRAPTPSAAAELMTPDQQEFADLSMAYRLRFNSGIRKIIQHSSQQLLWLSRQLKRPDRRLQEQAQNLDTLERNLHKAMNHRLLLQKSAIGQLSRSLNGVSPLATLGRGYSISYDDSGKVIRQQDDVQIGSKIVSRLAKGSMSSTVTELSD